MKAYKYMYAALLLALTACVSDEITIDDAGGSEAASELTYAAFEAVCEQPDSKVFLSDGNLTPQWQSTDEIAIYDNSTRKFTVKECSGNTATFEGSMSASYSGTVHAAYPYSNAGTRSGSSLTMTLPATQSVPAGMQLDPDALLSVAVLSGSSLNFRNVTGLVRLEIKDSGIASLTLSGNDGEALAGTLQADLATGTLTTAPTGTSVKLLPASQSSFEPGVYFIAAAPVSFSKGVTLTLVNTSGKTAVKSGESSVALVRSGGLDLGDVTSGLSWETNGEVPEDNDPNDDDIVGNTTFDRTVYVTYSSSGTASVSGAEGLTVTVSGNRVTITNSGKENISYELSGTASDGFFKLYSSKKQAIVLNGLNLTNKSGAAINNQSKKRTFVVVKGSNSLADGSTYTGTSGEDEKAAFFSEGQLIFSGSGSLSVTATGKSGIASDDYVRFMSSPTVKVSSSAGHAIKGKDYILVSNGKIEASVSAATKKAFTSDSLVVIAGGSTTIKVSGAAAYDSDDADFKHSSGIKADKEVRLSGGTLDITCTGAGSRGISSDDFVSVSGGSTTITMSGGVVYNSADKDYSGISGIKADNYFDMSDGSITITSTGAGGKGIRAGSYDYDSDKHTLTDSSISGGSITITTSGSESNDVSCKPVKIGWVTKSGSGDRATVTGNAGNLTVSGGLLNLRSSKSECLEVKGNLTFTGGEVYAYSGGDDAINSQGEMNIKGGCIYAWSTQNDAIDANHDLKISGGYVFAVTTKGSPELALDANTEGDYKLYIQKGATVVAYGGLESGYSASQTIYSFTATAGKWNALHDGSSYICAFKAPSGISRYIVTAPSLSKGYTNVTVGGTTLCNDGWALSGISGGSSATLSSYSGGSGGGGGGRH